MPLESEDESGEEFSFTTSSSGEDETTPFKGKLRVQKTYSQTPFNYERLNSNVHFLSLLIGKLPYFDETNYTKWRHNIKMYLISLNLSRWKVVCTGVELPDNDDDSLTPDQEQEIHRNAQATTVLLLSLSEKRICQG